MSRLSLRFSSVVQLLLASVFVVGCSDSGVDDGGDGGDGGGGTTQESEWNIDGVTEWIDETLSEIYLYNDEYNSLTDKDLDEDFDDFFYGNLTRLTTNVLDYKGEEGSKVLFSYIEGTSPSGETKSGATTSNDFGFVWAYAVVEDKSEWDWTAGFYVVAVYNDSPAYKAGIRRGMVICEVGGEAVTNDNYVTLFNSMIYPAANTQLNFKWWIKGATDSDYSYESAPLTAASYAIDPLLNCELIDPTEKIGYMNYISFDAYFDTELLAGFAKLRQDGAESLILDLRNNLGGYVSSASLMTSAITATSPDSNSAEVFQYYRFNSSLTINHDATAKWSGLGYDSSRQYFYENLSGVATENQLQLTNTTVYCLVGNNTASASEMVINALRGMDGFDVVLIGQTTRGKNVGMFVFDETFEDYSFEMAPISFENFNCDADGGYEDGMAPDYVIETDEELNFSDFSVDDALVAKAIALISGVPQRGVATRGVELSMSVDGVSSVTGRMTRGVEGALKRIER